MREDGRRKIVTATCSHSRHIETVCSKLMRLDLGRPEIRSKLYSNRLLIDFFDPNLPVRSIVATISIRIRIQISIFNLIYIENLSKNDYYRPKLTKMAIFVQIRPNF